MSRLARAAAPLLLGVVALAVYGQVLGFSFVTSDDWALIARNPTVTAWTAAPLRDRLLTPEFGYPIPVTVASFALDWALSGGHPGPFHRTNLLLHLGCALLVYRLLLRCTSAGAAFLGALLFVVHPVQAEAVAFITQRKDLLATLLSLLALTAALHGSGAAALLLAPALALLAGLSKPAAALLGAVLCAQLLALRGRPRTAAAWALCLLLPLASAAVLGLDRHVYQQNPVALAAAPSLTARAALVTGALRHYLEALLLPLQLTPRPPLDPGLRWDAIAASLLCAGLAVGALLRLRAAPGRLAAIWLIGNYIPISNILPLRRYAADSYLYLLMPAVAAAAAIALGALGRRAAVALLPLALLAGLAHRQVALWRNDLTLRAALYRLHPEQREALDEYTAELTRQGRYAEALSLRAGYFRRAAARAPTSPEAMRARRWLLRTCLQARDLPCARAAVAEAHPAHRETVPYWEARLELAMAEGDHAAAQAAARRLLALGAPPARAADLERLLGHLARLGP